MKTRPALKPGDVVRFSHRGALRYGSSAKAHSTMVVISVFPDGSDGHSSILVWGEVKPHLGVGKVRTHKFRIKRKMLWFTGKNVGPQQTSAYAQAQQSGGHTHAHTPTSTYTSKPKANEEKCMCGRMKDKGKKCWWCGSTAVAVTEYVQCWCGASKRKGEPCGSCGKV